GSRQAHPGKDARRTTPQCLGDQRVADAAVRTGNQNCLALECRTVVHFQASAVVSSLRTRDFDRRRSDVTEIRLVTKARDSGPVDAGSGAPSRAGARIALCVSEGPSEPVEVGGWLDRKSFARKSSWRQAPSFGASTT